MGRGAAGAAEEPETLMEPKKPDARREPELRPVVAEAAHQRRPGAHWLRPGFLAFPKSFS